MLNSNSLFSQEDKESLVRLALSPEFPALLHFLEFQMSKLREPLPPTVEAWAITRAHQDGGLSQLKDLKIILEGYGERYKGE